MTSKRGNKNFYKGKGAQKLGYVSNKARFVMMDHMVPKIVAPDLEGFALTPYVSRRTPKVERGPLTSDPEVQAAAIAASSRDGVALDK